MTVTGVCMRQSRNGWGIEFLQSFFGYRTDHSLLFLELQIDDLKKGKGFWRFNNSLLKDYDYVLQKKNIISGTQMNIKLRIQKKVHF